MSDQHAATGHIVPVPVYLAIFLALLGLTAATTAAAFVDLGVLNVVVMLAIAVTKAMLVILYFMHVRWSGRLLQMVVGIGFVFLAILIAITMADVLTRT